jgi:hypothetical protein
MSSKPAYLSAIPATAATLASASTPMGNRMLGGPIAPTLAYSIPYQGSRIPSIPNSGVRISSISSSFLSRAIPLSSASNNTSTGELYNYNDGSSNTGLIQPIYTTSTASAVLPAFTTTTNTFLGLPTLPAVTTSSSNHPGLPGPISSAYPIQSSAYNQSISYSYDLSAGNLPPIPPEQTLSVLSLSNMPYAPNITGSSIMSAAAPQQILTPEAQQFFGNLSSLSPHTKTTICMAPESFAQSPIFVSSAQYQQILKRRALRLKAAAHNKSKLTKVKHLSRQLHAARRIRGQGGRFLTKAEREAQILQQANNPSSIDMQQ